jgi:MoxR-like ATPase
MLKKNVEIEIPLKDPFQNDMLGRRKIAENLTLLVESTKQPFVLSVQAPWGWGMTTFIKMWKAYLESLGHVCFYFNAWENDFVEDPLIAFVGEINRTLADKSSKGQLSTQIRKLQNVGGKVVRRALPLTIQIATQGLLGQESVKKVSDLLFNSGGDIASFASELAEEKMNQYENDKNGVQEFRNELAKVTKSISEGTGRRSPAVFFIDELDRCRPEFSISLLERIAHVFSVKGMVFVLGIDRSQIEQSVKSKYGLGMDADGYLRRFIDFSVNLPEPTVEKYCQLLFERFQMQEVFAKRRDGKNELDALMRAFVNLAKAYHFSLRVIEQCFTEINLVLRTTPPDVRLYSYLLALLVALKTVRPNSFSLLLDELSPIDVNTLLDELKRELDVSDRVCRWMLAQFEVYLVFGCLGSDDLRAESLAALRANAGSQNPVERSYAQQVLRFAEKIQYDLYYREVRSLVSQIGLIEELTLRE